MISRYSRPAMSKIWELESRFGRMLDVEIAACEAMASIGKIPKKAALDIKKKAKFNVERIEQIEKEVKHDVIAFLTCVSENIGDSARFLHQGLTSSDVIDTGFSLQLSDAADILLEDLDALLKALKKRAIEHKKTICVGRSHGIHGEPTTFGLKLAGHYAAFKRAKERLILAKKEVSICALSGAVGTYATIDPRVEKFVAKKLKLKQEDVSTQIIPRDRHAMFFATLGVIASSVENLATEIRHLQRTEVREVEEYFSKGQKGSSAMPHKRNPVLSENLTGLARLVRSHVTPALENVTLWHERDISHSSVERIIAPDATLALDFALSRLASLIDGLVVYPERMKENLDMMRGLVFSQNVLLALTNKGVSREDAYKIVQENAMKVWANNNQTFSGLIAKDKRITKHLSPKELKDLTDYSSYLKNIDGVMKRVF